MSEPAESARDVICVSHGFLPEYERGFCNGLSSLDIAVTLIGSDRTDRSGLAPSIRVLNLRGSQDERRSRWHKAVNLLRYQGRLIALSWRQQEATWHVFGSIEPALWYGVVFGLWFRTLGLRYVLTVHNLLPHDRHTRFQRWCFGWAYRIPTQLVVHTQRMKSNLIDSLGLAPDRITCMGHGLEPIDERHFAGIRVGQKAAPVRILMFGRLMPYKGADVLLQALATVSFDFRLIVAGPSPDRAYRARLMRWADEHAISQHVDWQPKHVAEAEMSRIFETADLVVLPYRHIDQSGVLFQALRFGVPVVATRVGEFENLVTPDVGELAAPGDAASLANALNRWWLRRSSFDSRHIRMQARSHAWTETVKHLRELYPVGVSRGTASRREQSAHR